MSAKWPALLIALALLPACATGYAVDMPLPLGVREGDPRIEPCRREAFASPQVTAIAHRAPNPDAGDLYDRWRDDMRWEAEKLFVACLEREGALVRQPGQQWQQRQGHYGYDERRPPPLPD